MNLKIKTQDPLNILSSTKYVVENAKDVVINENNIKNIVKPVSSVIDKGLEDPFVSFGTKGNFEKDAQLILVEDSVNFCFWAEKGKQKWVVKYPKSHKVKSGWYALVSCFKRAFKERAPILDAKYLSQITLENTEKLFRGNGKVKIPLIEKRKENLNEVGTSLLAKYDGEFVNLIEESNKDIFILVNLVLQSFKSFRDSSNYLGKKVFFYKRAQIVASDISYLCKYDKRAKLKNLDGLTAFADYKLPQVLREYGIMMYSDNLSQKVDNYSIIPAGSSQEVEIRAATVWSVELIRQAIGKYHSPQIDNAIWLISQNQSNLKKPYHRTYTIYY
jgi:hypothetical protein